MEGPTSALRKLAGRLLYKLAWKQVVKGMKQASGEKEVGVNHASLVVSQCKQSGQENLMPLSSSAG